jgi:hypothetical protein
MAKRAKKTETAPPAPTTEKRKPGRPPNPDKAPKAAKAKAPSPGKGHNKGPTDRNQDDIREGFLVHRGTWNQLTAAQKALDKRWTDCKAALKADGYKVIQMQIADDLSGSPKQEAKVHAAVHDRLQVAQWVGHPMGNQLDLFAQPDRTPAVDRSRDEGKQASMENKPCKPPYDPSTPQHQAWIEGYQEDQARIASGIKPLKDDDGEGEDDDGGGWGESSERDPARPLQ